MSGICGIKGLDVSTEPFVLRIQKETSFISIVPMENEMHLKSIELYGFKSFANKMVFKFDEGITGIVGPNGSGKSNVADAVRWVLGEQSAKQLRGSKMQDVIFAGTEARKPLGYCQVDLTIDNHDNKMPIEYSEVTVSRRVYRSGEGEYFINGANCRMRDVQELFMDTGVGQEGYSIIGQGQIDKILSNKPNERRALFDEAAGIVKFRKRKEGAEKRLDNEKQNLYRINDIITELEGQRESLMEQAEKAKEYLTIKEELKTNEVNVFILDVKRIDERLKELEDKMSTTAEDIRQTRNAYQENKLKHDEYSKQTEALMAEMDDIRSKSTELSLQKEKKESEISLTLQQIEHLKENSSRYTREMTALQDKKLKLKEQLEGYKKEIQSIFDESNKSDEAIAVLEKEMEELNAAISKEEEVVSNIQANMIERLNEISNIRTEMQRFQTMAENTASRTNSVSSRKRILEQSLIDLKALYETEKVRLKEFQKEQKELAQKREEVNNRKREEDSNLERAANARAEKAQLLQRMESKHKALSDISEQYEGYNFSIKKVMSQKDRYQGKIVGVVADILTVAKEYERAIEIALGGSFQNIITEDEATAKSLIRFLKENRFGRATFLPLTGIKPNVKKDDRIRNEKGFIGYGDELVQVQNRFTDIAAYLLGRILIVDHIDNAIVLSKKFRSSRIVTLDGDVVNPGGSLTGGAFKNNNTQFLSRKRELEELDSQIKKGRIAVQGMDTMYQELKALHGQYEERLQEIAARLQELSINVNSQNMKIHQVDSDITKAKVELDELLLEENDLLSQESKLKEQLQALEQTLKENEVDRDQAEKSVRNMNAKSIKLKDQKDVLAQDLTDLRMENNTLVEKRNHAKSNVDRMAGEVEEGARAIHALELEIAGNSRKIIEKEEGITKYREEIGTFDEVIGEVSNKIERMTGQRQHLTKEQEALYTAQEEISEKINLLEKEHLRLENQVSKNATQKEDYMEYMWEEYELTYNNALEYFREELGTIGVIKKRIDRLKGDIRELGTVNVNAIEDYRNVAERYEFLSEQRADIIEAETKLREAIEELDNQMQHQFREQFALINTEFQRVFKELFGGGKAFLRLSDEEDVLQAGIHINVQPPGKKLQSMMLLSGGERAFTAIALMFAFQNLKPSPFCVLDEIEAALDDANVDRFAKYLQKLTDNTQFIIITHRRGTMEASDALYGITMQEKGISTQVSVKLIEDVLEV